jgi:hypothetical protein
MTSPTTASATGRPPRRARRRLLTLGLTLAAAAGLAGVAAPAALAAPAGIDGGVDLNTACYLQYPGQDAWATVYAPGTVYAWYCESNSGILGGININEECVYQYGPGAVALFYDYYNPDSWYCLS